jgi:hypothetical protein
MIHTPRSLLVVSLLGVTLSGCGPSIPSLTPEPSYTSVPAKPQPTLNDEVTLEIKPDADFEWLGFGAPKELKDLATQVSGGALGNKPGCEKLINDYGNVLTEAHNKLVEVGAVAPFDERLKAWVDVPAETPIFYTSFIQDAIGAAAGVYVPPIAGVDVKAAFDVDRAKVSLVVASAARTVSLSGGAVRCVQANICAATAGKGGDMVDKLVYGSLIRLGLSSSTTKFDAGVGVSGYVKVNVKLSVDGIQIKGGLIGDVSGAYKSDGSIYGMSLLLADLQQKDFLVVANRLRATTKRYGVIGRHVVPISSGVCASLGK